MPVAAGVRETLDEQHARAFGPSGAVRGCREGLAAAVGREAALPAELHEDVRGRHDGDAADQGHRALALAQRLRGEVQGDERRRAGRVHGHRRPLQAERVGDAARGDAARAAVDEVSLEAVGHGGQAGAVVVVHDAGEDAGPGAAQRRRVDPGPLEHLPRRLQQQPLLGIHGQRFARGYPEEPGVELGRVVKEPALARITRTRVIRIRMVQGIQRPAAVHREASHRIAALGDEPPQVLRRPHTTRVAAAHPDDRDRITVGHGRDLGPLLGIGVGADQFGQQEAGECVGCRPVEDEGRGEPQAGGGVEGVPQFDRGERVEAEVPELPVHRDRPSGFVAEDRRHLGTDQIEDEVVPLVGGQGGDPLGRRGPGAPSRRVAGALERAPYGGAHQVPEQRRQGSGAGLRLERAGVQPDRDHGGEGGAARGVEQCQALLRLQRDQSGPADPVPIHGGQAGRERAGLRPQAPGDGNGGESLGPSCCGEGVQEGVRGGVVGLAGAAERAGGGREEDEGGEVRVPGQLVEVQGRVGLRAEHPVDALRRERGDGAVVGDAGGVHHTRQRPVRRNRREQPGQLGTIRHVAADGPCLGAQRPQFRGELGRAFGVRAPAAGQQQVPYPVLGDQVACDQTAQHAGGTGDQHGAFGREGRGAFRVAGCERGFGRCVGGPHESRNEQGSVANSHLRLARGHRRRQPGGGVAGGVDVDVDQHEPARVLRLCRAHQPPDGGLHHIHSRIRIGGGGRHGAPRHDDQARRSRPLVQQPLLEQRQHPVHGGGRCTVIAVAVAVAVAVEQCAHRNGNDVRDGPVRARIQIGRALTPHHLDRLRGRLAPLPVHSEQRILMRRPAPRGAAGLGELLGSHRPQVQRVDRCDRPPQAVGDQQRHRLRAGVGTAQTHPQRLGAGSVHADTTPGERQPALVARGEELPRAHGVQSRVEQGRVHGEPVGGDAVRQGDLGEQLVVPAPPHGAQAPEHRPVREAGFGEPLVAVVDVDTGGVGGRPHPAGPGHAGCIEGGRLLDVGHEEARRVARPGGSGVPAGLVGGLGTRVDLHRPPARRVVGGADDHPHLDGAVLREHQGCGKGEFVDAAAAELVSGPDGHVEEGRAGEQGHTRDGVVREPRVRGQ